MPEIPGSLSKFDSTTTAILQSSERSSITSTRQSHSWLRILLLIAVLLPSIIAFVILFRQAFHVPYQDDYSAVLAFAGEYRQLPDWGAKAIHILTKQTNDYKLAFAHLIIAADLELTGHLNFRFLVFLGNLCLLPIAYLFWRSCSPVPGCRLDQRLIRFLPISLMLFSLVYWETLDWCMAGLQNLPVILFSLLSITLLIPRIPEASLARVLLASLSAALAALSSANGFLVAPIGLLVLLPRRAFGAATLWCASFLIPIASYLYGYSPYSVSVQSIHSRSWLIKASYSLAFLGCAIPNRWAATILGLALFVVFGLSIRSRFYRKHPVPFYFTLWVFATAVLVGSLRGTTIASRYSIYSIFVLIFAYFFLAEQLPGRVHPLTLKRLYTASLVCALLFFIAGDVRGYRKLGERRQMALAGIEHYRANPEMNSPMIDPRVLAYAPGESEFERVQLTDALRNHLLVLPPRQNSN
jgi:hypothetical protein